MRANCRMRPALRSAPARAVALALLLLHAAAPAPAREPGAPPATGDAAAPAASAASRAAHPEAATGFVARESVRASRFLAVTANPYATDAAHAVLAGGGSAVDAAITAQMVLTLVEPQSSGIGGGGFMLVHDPGRGELMAYDGRETAPRAASEGLFLDAEGKPLPFFDAVVGGRAVGTPGLVRMLEMAHARHGRLPWAALFAPAIALAREGFQVSPRLHALLERDRFLRLDAAARAYFYDASGAPWPVGYRLRNPALADALQAIAERGSYGLHAGRLAQAIVDKVRSHPANPGLLALHDLAAYRAKAREPVCAPYLRFVVCGMPPPSSGGITVAQILMLLERAQAPALVDASGVLQVDGVHHFAEAGRLAFADRNRYLADPDFVATPRGLLDPAYLAERARLIDAGRSMGKAEPGRPAHALALGDGRSYPEQGTTHLSIIDTEGNAVALTASIENAFGARQMVSGFLLNNQLTDFAFAPIDAAGLVANRVQGGKRPRSSMAPTLVFERADDGGRGALVMALGSPGGSAIINYVAKTLVATLAGGLDIQQAISLPNLGSRNGPTEFEAQRDGVDALAEALRLRGHLVRIAPMTSGIHAIFVRRGRAGDAHVQLLGGVDPRREGLARGE